MAWIRQLLSDRIPGWGTNLKFSPEELPEELRAEAKELKFDPNDKKYTTLCGRLKCTPKTATILICIQILIILLLAILVFIQIGVIDGHGNNGCDYCLGFILIVVTVLALGFLISCLFLFVGVLKMRPWAANMFYCYQLFLASAFLIVGLVIFCATSGPYDERRLFGEWKPPAMIIFGVVCYLVLPFECVLMMYGYRFHRLLADMMAEEEVVNDIQKKMEEIKVTDCEIQEDKKFRKPVDTKGIPGNAIVHPAENGGRGMVGNGSKHNGQNGARQIEAVDTRRSSTIDSQRLSNGDRRSSQRSENAIQSYLEEGEETQEFPCMPYAGYQGYRYTREMENYDNQLMEIQKAEMIRIGLSEKAAEQIAEAAAAKRVEEREKREQEEDENQTYDDVVEMAKEEEQEQQAQDVVKVKQ